MKRAFDRLQEAVKVMLQVRTLYIHLGMILAAISGFFFCHSFHKLFDAFDRVTELPLCTQEWPKSLQRSFPLADTMSIVGLSCWQTRAQGHLGWWPFANLLVQISWAQATVLDFLNKNSLQWSEIQHTRLFSAVHWKSCWGRGAEETFFRSRSRSGEARGHSKLGCVWIWVVAENNFWLDTLVGYIRWKLVLKTAARSGSLTILTASHLLTTSTFHPSQNCLFACGPWRSHGVDWTGCAGHSSGWGRSNISRYVVNRSSTCC